MHNRLKKIIILLAFSWLILPAVSFAWHDYSGYGDGWDYHGSGRDHPYSAYIDRANYVGPADYATTVLPDYIDGPLVFSPVITTQPNAFNVNIPNVHGGYNVVVIKRSGTGFVGPDGEYYPEFPKVFQLEMKYGN